MTRKEIKEDIKKLKEEINSIYSEAEELRYKFISERWVFLDNKRDKIRELRELLLPKKRPELEIPKDIEDWFYKYKSGVNWGYGGIKIIYISPKKRYVIVTSKGGTAGTGTAMGTGGYYYAPSTHWVIKVGDTDNLSKVRNIREVESRLTKDKKQEMINKILELENDKNPLPQ